MKGEASSTGIYVRLVVVAIVWGASFIAGRVVSTEIDAVTAALWRYVIATTALVVSARVWGALAYIWFYDGVLKIGPARTAIFINLVPVVAITLGVLLLGERLTAPMVVGATLVVSGVFIINRTPTTSTAGHHAYSHTG